MRKDAEAVIRQRPWKSAQALPWGLASVVMLVPLEAMRLPAEERAGLSQPRALGEAPPETPYEARPGRTLKPRRRRHVRTLKPGAPGTKRLVEQYGDRLLSVRYIYDADTGRRYKTVQLLLEEAPWTPARARLDPEQLVGLRVGYDELALREAVKSAGGRWDRVLQVWVLPYKTALHLRLQLRVTHAAPASPPSPESRATLATLPRGKAPASLEGEPTAGNGAATARGKAAEVKSRAGGRPAADSIQAPRTRGSGARHDRAERMGGAYDLQRGSDRD